MAMATFSASNRSAKFVAAIFASMLAGTFAAIAQDAAKETAAKTADSCLSKPKGTVPAGGHWYYRFDRANKRNCWYIGEEKNKSARVAAKDSPAPPESSNPATPPPASPSAAEPAASPQTITVRKSIADARAELTAPQARVEDLIEPQLTGAAPVGGTANSQRAAAPDTAAPPSNVASRWPESSGVASSSGPRLAAAEPPQNPQPSNPQPQSPPPQTPQAKAASQPPAAPVALAAADAMQERQSASMQMLLLTLAGALALAGVTASLIFRFARTSQAQPEIRADRRTIWDSVQPQRRAPSIYPAEDTPVWRRDPLPDPPRDPRAPDDPERRVTEMLSRLARSAHS
jgi:hypothetical protein